MCSGRIEAKSAQCRYTAHMYVIQQQLVSLSSLNLRRIARRTVFTAVCIAFLLVAGVCARAQMPSLLVCYGDSITAGYGLDPEQAYPAALDRLMKEHKQNVRVVNRGTSGATTKDALAGLPTLLRLRPQTVIVEFGGNDGLRGLPLSTTRQNLDKLLSALDGAHVRVVLAGISLPPNYGSDYIQQFESIYRDLAAKHHVTLIPMLYKDLVHKKDTIQEDGIHPTAKGSELIAKTVLAALGKVGRM